MDQHVAFWYLARFTSIDNILVCVSEHTTLTRDRNTTTIITTLNGTPVTLAMANCNEHTPHALGEAHKRCGKISLVPQADDDCRLSKLRTVVPNFHMANGAFR